MLKKEDSCRDHGEPLKRLCPHCKIEELEQKVEDLEGEVRYLRKSWTPPAHLSDGFESNKKGDESNIDDYGYDVVYSDADEGFIATVEEFPLLTSHGRSAMLALETIRGEVREAPEDEEGSE